MDESKYVPWDVHTEFSKRMEDEHDRISHRLTAVEESVREIGRLTVSVEKMAVSMETMSKEQAKMSERLTDIEQKPARRWDSVIGAVITGIIGLLIGLVSAGIIK